MKHKRIFGVLIAVVLIGLLALAAYSFYTASHPIIMMPDETVSDTHEQTTLISPTISSSTLSNTSATSTASTAESQSTSSTAADSTSASDIAKINDTATSFLTAYYNVSSDANDTIDYQREYDEYSVYMDDACKVEYQLGEGDHIGRNISLQNNVESISCTSSTPTDTAARVQALVMVSSQTGEVQTFQIYLIGLDMVKNGDDWLVHDIVSTVSLQSTEELLRLLN